MLNEQDPAQLSGSNLQVFDASFLSGLSQVDQIHDKLYRTESGTLLRIESVVYAKSVANSAGPTWITNPPRDDRHIYFVGQASFPDLLSAKTASLENAYSEAAKRISKTNVPSVNLVSLIAESGSVQDSYIGFNQGIYTFYTLFRLCSEILNILPASNEDSVPFISETSRTRFLNGINVSHDGSPGSKRMACPYGLETLYLSWVNSDSISIFRIPRKVKSNTRHRFSLSHTRCRQDTPFYGSSDLRSSLDESESVAIP